MGDFKRGTRVYVGGLGEDTKKEDLETEFEKFGKLNSVWVAFNPPGFAFVEFSDREDAVAACERLNDTDILGARLRVEISRGRGRGRGGGRFSGGRGNRSPPGGRSYRGGGGGGGGGFRGGGMRNGGGSYSGGRGGGRYDDYGRGRSGDFGGRDSGYGGSGFGGGRGGGRGGGYRGNRDSYGGGGSDYYGGGRDSGASRFRSRSPVGRNSLRDYGGSIDYAQSGNRRDGYSNSSY